MRKRSRQSASTANLYGGALNARPSSPLLSVASCPCPPDTTPFRSRFGPGAQCSPTITHRTADEVASSRFHHAMTLYQHKATTVCSHPIRQHLAEIHAILID